MPGAPDKPKLGEITDQTIMLLWKQPTNDGGSPITGYTIEMRTSETNKWQRLDDTTEITYIVKRLTQNVEYEFRVCSKNAAGTSQPSPATEITKAKPIGRPPVIEKPLEDMV